MTTGAIAAVVFIALIVSLVLTVPIGFSLGIASLAYIFATDQLTLGFVARNMVTGTDSFPIMAIPFFVFAGELMGGGGISKRLLDVANVFFGRIRGGLAIVTVVGCMYVLRGYFRFRPCNRSSCRRYGCSYYAGKRL